MKTAVIGSRTLTVEDIGQYLPNGTDEIITGGAKGVDRCAGEYAEKHSIPLTVIPPDYRRYKKGAPLVRNLEIIRLADFVLAFWDGKSQGTRYVIEQCRKEGRPVRVVLVKPQEKGL